MQCLVDLWRIMGAFVIVVCVCVWCAVGARVGCAVWATRARATEMFVGARYASIVSDVYV